MDPTIRSALQGIPPAPTITLILPFTPSLLADPSPLLPTIYTTCALLPQSSLLVYFSTPSAGASGQPQQLYDTLLRSPRDHWDALQGFLSRVYSTLAAAQWKAGKILLSVEVGFESRLGRYTPSLKGSDVVCVVEGFKDLVPLLAATETIVLPKAFSADAHTPSPISRTSSSASPPVVALGGTFDHLHAAHKLLLHLAFFLATRKLIVGVMSDSLLSSKKHRDLVEPLAQRIAGVEGFLHRLGALKPPDLLAVSHSNVGNSDEAGEEEDGAAEDAGERVIIDVVEIHDAYGPTRDDPDIQALVISDETRSGGEAVNKLRRENGLRELEIWAIEVISPDQTLQQAGAGSALSSTGSLRGMDESALREVKMGSTGIRSWLAQHADR